MIAYADYIVVKVFLFNRYIIYMFPHRGIHLLLGKLTAEANIHSSTGHIWHHL